MKIVSLVGARPQFVKEAMLGRLVRERQAWDHVLVHSGQHYDMDMSQVFFDELGIPAPQYHLNVGSGTHGRMTGAILAAVEAVLELEKPAGLLVYGDTNTTLAGALAAAKLDIPVIHAEAGIRMLPKNMPEEINRVLTDKLSTVLCCCSELGERNLAREGIAAGVCVTGDIMHDVFLHMRPRFTPETACATLGVPRDGFALATLHRTYNVDFQQPLVEILQGLLQIQAGLNLPVLVPLHPRTRARIRDWGLESLAAPLQLCPPLGYLELMSLLLASRFVVTDSGGLQKEAYYAGRRALVVMPDTGWRELTDAGWNILVKPRAEDLAENAERLQLPFSVSERIYGEGNAALHIVNAVTNALC